MGKFIGYFQCLHLKNYFSSLKPRSAFIKFCLIGSPFPVPVKQDSIIVFGGADVCIKLDALVPDLNDEADTNEGVSDDLRLRSSSIKCLHRFAILMG